MSGGPAGLEAAADTPGGFDAQDAPSIDGLRACVHCGICLPQCPTYRVLGEEMDSPRGRLYLMRAASEGRTGLTPTLARHLELCLGCRACETACPSGVQFGTLLEATRGQLERRGVRSPEADRRAVDLALRLFPYPERLRPLALALRLYQRSGLQRLARWSGLPRRLGRLGALEALLPEVPPAAARRLPGVVGPARGPARGRAGMLLGCVQRYFAPEVNRATVRLLTAAGWEVVAPPEQGCCGALHLHAGRIEEFRGLVRRFLAHFADVDVLVVNAAGCGSTLKDCGRWLPEAAGLAAKVRDVSEVLVDADLPLRSLPGTVTYHDACHLAHGQRVRLEPRMLLGRIPDLKLVELPDSDLCCGSAGVYNILELEMADELARRKLEAVRRTGARTVAAANPGCLLQIAKQARAEGFELEVVHPVVLLERALAGSEGRP